MNHIPFDSPHPADSNKTPADLVRQRAVELPHLLVSFPGGVHTDFSLLTATGGLQLRAIYHSIRLVRRILMRPLRTLADAWLVRYPSFSCTKSYSHATATSHTPIDSSRPADSNETLADSIRPLVVKLHQLLVCSLGGVPTDFSLVTATGGPQPRAIHHSIRLVWRILVRNLRTQSDRWLLSYLNFW